jgi:transglutaminase-like putative cysteine protease
MSQLHIHHTTIYRYQKAVKFGAHQLRIRPIEDHEKKIISFDLKIQPAHRIRWAYDQFQNPVGYVEFTKASKELVVISDLKVELGETNPFDFILEPYCIQIPFIYSSSEFPDLIPYLTPLYPMEKEAILSWVKPFLNFQGEAKTIDCLTAINRAIPKMMSYQARNETGTQTPAETLKSRSGACRDFAVLFMETARHLGIASRFVSGYIRNVQERNEKSPNLAAGAMHAWAQVYLPGAGWKDFDPTAGILTSNEHLRVAVGRTPEQTTPITGAYLGTAKLDLGFEVDVQVSKI